MLFICCIRFYLIVTVLSSVVLNKQTKTTAEANLGKVDPFAFCPSSPGVQEGCS